MSYCSPDHDDVYQKTKTCYTVSQLKEIAKKYNSKNSNKININTNKTQLLQSIRSRLSGIHESKWYKTLDLNNEDMKGTFKPQKPSSWKKDNKTWLNTYDILNVMQQYEEKYPSFKFLGVYPLDFNHKYDNVRCVGPNMCQFSVKDMLKLGKTQCGVILNLDYHDEPGSHWVSLYIGLSPSLKNFGCYFIDSTSRAAPKEVLHFIKDVKKQIDEHYGKLDISQKFKIVQNKKKFQFENTECGMFSMYFMIQFLKKKEFKTIINSKITDQEVNSLRDVYYNPM